MKKRVDELTSFSAQIDDPKSIGLIAPGQVTTNIGKMYYKRPKNKFPYQVRANNKTWEKPSVTVDKIDPSKDPVEKAAKTVFKNVNKLRKILKNA